MSLSENKIESVNIQKAQTTNQIKSEKPDIIKNMNVLEGYIANSCNGGMIKPICYMPVMAGSRIADYRIRLNIKMLTPRTPVFQKLKCVIKTFFVPNKRVWRNWEKFLSQKGGETEDKILEVPNYGGFTIPNFGNSEMYLQRYSLVDTELWRDSWISTYIPRWQTQGRGTLNDSDGSTNSQTLNVPLPKYSALPARGFIAIYNDFLRHKEYDTPIYENTGDNASNELLGYIPNNLSIKDCILRGKRQDSYFTNYRTELAGFSDEFNVSSLDNQFDLNEYLKLVSESRSQATNAQKNDWDVISEIRGSKKLTEGKVQLLGTRECGINYQPVTQDTYNINTDIQEQFQTLGEQGAFSFTEVNVSMFDMQEFKEDGYLHTIIQITADSVFETAFERTGLNVRWDEQYRPDLVNLKDDVLYKLEKCGNGYKTSSNLMEVDGFKRKFSEYFKAPNCISGDLCNSPIYQVVRDNDEYKILGYTNDDTGSVEANPIQNQSSYTFFEIDDRRTLDMKKKNIWQDYTDLLINDNQAIVEEISEFPSSVEGDKILYKHGPNQLFFIGMQGCVIDMPINENIKNDFTKFGER